MGIILWIIFGALVGWLASLVMGTDAKQGALGNILLGILGAFLGGLLMNMFGYSGISGFNLYSTLVAILGAVIIVGVSKVFS